MLNPGEALRVESRAPGPQTRWIRRLLRDRRQPRNDRAEREEAIDAGPAHVDSDRTHPDLMDMAGFDHVEATDVTAEYVATLTAWWREWNAASTELEAIVGEADFTERQTTRMRAARAARAGLLRRYLISGTRT